MTSRSRLWLIAILSSLFVFCAPLIAADTLQDDDPELRLIRTGDRFSALIVGDRSRVLVINSGARGDTRSAVGLLARPWEPDPQTVLALADDDAAVGLWEVLRHPSVRQVLIVGLPGSNPVWSSIEREASGRGITVEYVAETSEVVAGELGITIVPARGADGAFIALHRNDARVVLALDDGAPTEHSHLAVLNHMPQELSADLAVVAGVELEPPTNVLAVNEREVVRVVLAQDEIRVGGGRLFETTEAAN